MSVGDAAVLRAARASAGTAVVEGKVVDQRPRCRSCGRTLPCPYAARPWSIWCRHCRVATKSASGS